MQLGMISAASARPAAFSIVLFMASFLLARRRGEQRAGHAAQREGRTEVDRIRNRSGSESSNAVTPRSAAALWEVERYEVIRGGLYRNGIPVPIRRGLLYVFLARAGWKGEDGVLSPEFVRRLRTVDPRLPHLYLRGDAA